jgi:hypothetical protein
MQRRIFLLFSWLLLHAIAHAQKAPAKPITVLIIDGFSNHDWKQTSNLTKRILEETKRFKVSISTTPPTMDDPAWASWNPRFEAYDVVIQNTNNIKDTILRWPRKIEEQLEKYVSKGGGLYILHSANNAFPHWKEYDRMIGLGWRSRQTGLHWKSIRTITFCASRREKARARTMATGLMRSYAF